MPEDSQKTRVQEIGPLHELMLHACPIDDPYNQTQSISRLALLIDRSPQALYNAIRRGRVTPTVAQKIVQASRGRVKIEDFYPYIFV